jgi:peptidylprolyl isomerase domain and WD repeat-containing protein 1
MLCTQVYLQNLPSAAQYELSYMHRDVVTHIAVAKNTDFLITGSADGQVKFWKKMMTSVEFVKHFQVRFPHCFLNLLPYNIFEINK